MSIFQPQGRSPYRRGLPVLLAGLGLTVAAVLVVVFPSVVSKERARTVDAQASTTSSSPASSVESSPSSEPSVPSGPPYLVPVETEPRGAVVWEVDGGRRTLLCAETPCVLKVERARAAQMIVSLELAGHERSLAHVKDATSVPGGGSISLSFKVAESSSLDNGGWGRLSQSYGRPTLRQGTTEVNGRLPPEVIQRIVRQNFGRFRLCYESGLQRDPNLKGRIATKFVIDASGSVASTVDGGSDLRDPQVVACVVRAFQSLSFPQPDGGGIVTVKYPVIFNPAD